MGMNTSEEIAAQIVKGRKVTPKMEAARFFEMWRAYQTAGQ
jgi:hypothetical protein